MMNTSPSLYVACNGVLCFGTKQLTLLLLMYVQYHLDDYVYPVNTNRLLIPDF